MSSTSILNSMVRWFAAPRQNALRWGVALSLLTHAVVLAWEPPIKTPPASRPPSLDVVLVNTFSDQAPMVAQLVAQQNLEGGGQTDDRRIASNPMPRVGIEDEDISLQELTEQRQQLEAQQDQLLRQLRSVWVTRLAQTPGQSEQDAPQAGADEVDQQSLEQNARIAATLDQIERYNQRPRKYYEAPSAIASPFAGYVDAWRVRIEDTGSKHYPSGGDQPPRGDLQATVTIAANGALLDITIDRPSADARLNQALRRILELAQPFPPFPDHLAKEIDQLVITRTWRFTPGLLTTQTP